jgi:hypothetical protein
MTRFVNLVGRRFTRLVVIERAPNGLLQGQTMWLCKCDCGTEKVIAGPNLNSGKVRSCGCLAAETKVRKPRKTVPENNLLGRVFGRLTVLGREEDNRWRASRWLCQCTCGEKSIVVASRLITGRTKSCGCLAKERRAEARCFRAPPPPEPTPDFSDPLLKPWS